jgi:hypothetical protein
VDLVVRDGQLIPVRGATILRAGDEIIALTDPEHTPTSRGSSRPQGERPGRPSAPTSRPTSPGWASTAS